MSAEILDACCGGRHWWWDKNHPLAIYLDKRIESPGSVDVRPNWSCEPDIVGDFRAMPFRDESFRLPSTPIVGNRIVRKSSGLGVRWIIFYKPLAGGAA